MEPVELILERLGPNYFKLTTPNEVWYGQQWKIKQLVRQAGHTDPIAWRECGKGARVIVRVRKPVPWFFGLAEVDCRDRLRDSWLEGDDCDCD